jgi:hypothetical protein
MEEEKKEPMEEPQAEPKPETVEQPPQEPEKKERPTFLTVLCILSFIGIGIAVISNLISLFATSAGSAIMDAATETLEEYQDIPGMDMVESAVDYASTLAIINIIAALVCLWGVIWMWNLKKTGYYIYVVAELAPVIISFILVGLGSFLGGFLALVGLIFPVLFVILYGLNVKHMS